MICLEMIGYFSGEEGSQSYPLAPMKFLYGERGDFIAVVSNLEPPSVSLLRSVADAMQESCRVRVERLSVPAAVPGVDFSDHLNYWKHGFPAVMVTDTAFYRNPNYHEPTDTAETLDYPSMARIRLTRSFDERQHSYQGYLLRVDGVMDGEPREFSVAVGKVAHEKHAFEVGMEVSSETTRSGRARGTGRRSPGSGTAARRAAWRSRSRSEKPCCSAHLKAHDERRASWSSEFIWRTRTVVRPIAVFPMMLRPSHSKWSSHR